MDNDCLNSNATNVWRNITHGIGLEVMTCVNEGSDNESLRRIFGLKQKKSVRMKLFNEGFHILYIRHQILQPANFMDRSPSWKAASYASSQENPGPPYKLLAYCRLQSSPYLVCNLSHMNPLRILHNFNSNFGIPVVKMPHSGLGHLIAEVSGSHTHTHTQTR